MKYPIIIPSRGRANACATIENIPSKFYDNIWLYVIEAESAAYQATNEILWNGKVHVICAAPSTVTISEKRERMVLHITERTGTKKFWMMDDDLKFFRRKNEWEGDTRLEILHVMDDHGFDTMFDEIETMMDDPSEHLCAIGISMRQGNNNLKDVGDRNTRLIRCGLYDAEPFLEATHNRLKFMGDFDVMLQMLERGWDNFVVAKYSQDHGSTNAKGGCAVARTEEVMEEVAHGLAALHPGCVVTKKKANKTGGLKERTDVTIYWKKARASYPGF